MGRKKKEDDSRKSEEGEIEEKTERGELVGNFLKSSFSFLAKFE